MNNTDPLTWHVLPFQELGADRLYDVLRLRTDVFVVEQRCPYAELDGRDREAFHVLGVAPDGRLAAYARILPPDQAGWSHIGRVVVHPEHRGKGLGRAVMEQCLAFLRATRGSHASALSAQEHLRAFYEDLGYQAVSGTYDWDGIPHVDMRLNAPT